MNQSNGRIGGDRHRPPTAVDEHNAVISVAGLSRSFGDTNAVHEVDLDVRAGEIFGLIGPSGCGKSSLMKLIAGLVAPSDGKVRVYGQDPRTFGPTERQRVGYVPQSFVLYGNLTVEQNARFVAGLYGLGWRHRRTRIQQTLQLLELWPARKRRAKDLSGGMLRRLSIACALLHEPSLLLVDEPTAALDPLLRAKVWEHMEKLRDRGTTVFVTTQYIDEAVHCDRVAIMREGQIIAIGSPESLRREAAGGEALEVVATGIRRSHVQALWNEPEINRVTWDGQQRLRVVANDAAVATPVITQVLNGDGVHIEEIRTHVPTFEDVFVALVKTEPTAVEAVR
jgi:ABC-2 type transport system ATP-binding protein